ncbi:MAG: DnaJ domain-containing protein [Desulfobacteraceae bacterium]
MADKDYHNILGIGKDAGPEEIKRAYRRMAMRHHPDTSGGDPGAKERFEEINEAYHVLSDRAGRSRKGRDADPSESVKVPIHRGTPRRSGGLGSDPPWGRFRSFDWFDWDLWGLNGFFPGDPFFTHGRPRPGSQESTVHEIQLTPDEARQGAERELIIHLPGETLRITVEVPAGVEDGTLLKVVGPKTKERGIELYLKAKIPD